MVAGESEADEIAAPVPADFVEAFGAEFAGEEVELPAAVDDADVGEGALALGADCVGADLGGTSATWELPLIATMTTTMTTSARAAPPPPIPIRSQFVPPPVGAEAAFA